MTGYGPPRGSAAGPATFFVSNTGLDTNNGTSTVTPWQHVAKVNSGVTNGCATISFNGGQSFTDAALEPTVSGTSGCPLTFTSYGTGRATLAPAGTAAAFEVLNQDNIVFNNINIAPTGTGGGFYLSATSGTHSNITLNNFNVTSGAGNYVGGDSGTAGFSNVLIENFVISGQTADGIGVYGSGGAGVKVHSNVTVQSGTISGSALNGIYIGNTNTGLIQNVVAHNNGASSTVGPVGIWTYESNAVTIQFNESYANLSANTTDGDWFRS
jgi:hypothetical protein